MRVDVAGLLALSGLLAAPAGAQAPPLDTIAIEHVTVLPMDRDTALTDHTVLTHRDRIVWVGASASAIVSRAVRRVDGRGAYLMPGLADMHVHLAASRELTDLVAAGITTVRNMRGAPEHLAWRDSVERGQLVGPTIYTSGPSIRKGPMLGKRDPRFVFPSTPDEAESLVRSQVRAGYDMIKVLAGLSRPVYERLLRAARSAGVPVVGHVISDVGLERSLAAGQVSFEHAYDLHERSRFSGIMGDDRARTERDAHAVAQAGAWVGTIASARDGTCAPRSEQHRGIIASLRRAGVKLLAGTDAGIGPVRAGPSLLCELTTLVAAGLTHYEALASATVNAGAFARAHLKRADVPFGTVTVGSRADLVLLAADPRTDLRTLARPIGVLLRGQWRAQRTTAGT